MLVGKSDFDETKDEIQNLSIIDKMQLIETLNTIMHHKEAVQEYMNKIVSELQRRAKCHDDSKFNEDEFFGFNAINATAGKYPFSNDERSNYRKSLKRQQQTINIHYSRNDHHPEYFDNPKEMNIFQLIEMVCDWKAAHQIYSQKIKDNQVSEPISWDESLQMQKERYKDTFSECQWKIINDVANFLAK